MLTPEQSLRALVGAGKSSPKATPKRCKKAFYQLPFELEGSRFGAVVQRQRVIIRRPGNPIQYGALYCEGCNKPLHKSLDIGELMHLYRNPSLGCGRPQCRVRSPLARVEAQQANLPNERKIAVNLTLYKLLLPELVPTTFGGTYGFPEVQPTIPTDIGTARKFCQQMGVNPKSTSRNLFLHVQTGDEALTPQTCGFTSAIPKALLQRVQDVSFTIAFNNALWTYYDLEDVHPGKFSECVLKMVSLRNPFQPIEQRNKIMLAVFKKLEAEEAESSLRVRHPSASRFYSDLYDTLKELKVGDAVEVTNIPEEVTLGNLYNALKRRGLHPSLHYGFNKKIYADGKRLPKTSRVYIARKLEEFPKNDCNRQ